MEGGQTTTTGCWELWSLFCRRELRGEQARCEGFPETAEPSFSNGPHQRISWSSFWSSVSTSWCFSGKSCHPSQKITALQNSGSVQHLPRKQGEDAKSHQSLFAAVWCQTATWLLTPGWACLGLCHGSLPRFGQLCTSSTALSYVTLSVGGEGTSKYIF